MEETVKSTGKWVLLGLGVAILVAGVILIASSGGSHTGTTGGVTRASTSNIYGADFYTDSSNYTALAANAATDIYRLLSQIAGMFFIFIGCVDLCITACFWDLCTSALTKLGEKREQNVIDTAPEPSAEEATASEMEGEIPSEQ